MVYPHKLDMDDGWAEPWQLDDWPSLLPTKNVGRHRFVHSPLARALWIQYKQRITRPGRWFLGLSFLFLSFGASSLELQIYVPLAYILGAWVVAVLGALLYRPRVTIEARHGAHSSAGSTLPVEMDVHSNTRSQQSWLYVQPYRLPEQIDCNPELGVPLPVLAAGETQRVRFDLVCKRRGVYLLRGFRVCTDLPAGILVAHRIFQQHTRLIVYPTFRPLSRLDIKAGRNYQPGGIALASSVGESFEYVGNREYRQGDDVRALDWRATARLNKPIVREYREEYLQRVAVVLDTYIQGAPTWDPNSPGNPQGLLQGLFNVMAPRGSYMSTDDRKEVLRQREALERAISLAAAVSDRMARQDFIIDLFAAGPYLYHLTAGRSLAYLDQILDILACVEETTEEPFHIIEPELLQHLTQITTVICILLDWNEERRDFVYRLHEEGASVKVVVVRDGPCTMDPAHESDRLGNVSIIDQAQFEAGVESL